MSESLTVWLGSSFAPAKAKIYQLYFQASDFAWFTQESEAA